MALEKKYKIVVAEFDEDESYIIGDNEVEEYLGNFSEREQEICSEQCMDRISEYIKNKIKEKGNLPFFYYWWQIKNKFFKKRKQIINKI